MRIAVAKATLSSRWAWSTGLGLCVFAILLGLDQWLKFRSGVGTADLVFFTNAAQFRVAFWAWGRGPYLALAGFNLGFDYLLMPLYAASFFYSGVLTAETFAPKPGRLRRLILLAAMVPLVGALCDACENALQLTMLLGGVSDTLATLSSTASTAKLVALAVGVALLAGAFAARIKQRRAARKSVLPGL
jgi:hypothetical protein